MKKMLLILFILLTGINGTLIWFKIPHYFVSESVVNFLKMRDINECFYKFENEDKMLLKCLVANELVDVEISIKNKKKIWTNKYNKYNKY